MLELVHCDWWTEVYPDKNFLEYARENFENLSFKEKVESLLSLFDNNHTILFDDSHEKIFIYFDFDGSIKEVNDNEIYEWICDFLDEWDERERMKKMDNLRF